MLKRNHRQGQTEYWYTCIQRDRYGGQKRGHEWGCFRESLFSQILCSTCYSADMRKWPLTASAPRRPMSSALLPTGCLTSGKSWHQAAVPISLPQDDVHRFQTGCDIGFGDLRSVSFQHVGLCGFHVWHRGCQPLPEAQEIVHTIWGKFPVLRKTKRAGGIFLIFCTH